MKMSKSKFTHDLSITAQHADTRVHSPVGNKNIYDAFKL